MFVFDFQILGLIKAINSRHQVPPPLNCVTQFYP